MKHSVDVRLRRLSVRFLAILSALGSAALGATSVLAADVTVETVGVVPGPGAIRVALYRGADGFRHEEHAVQVLSAPARSSGVSVTFHNVAPGRYAVLAYHDANDDKKLDLRFGMFPKEGWGLSNNPKVMGPPSFNASAFEVAGQTASTKIEMHY